MGPQYQLKPGVKKFLTGSLSLIVIVAIGWLAFSWYTKNSTNIPVVVNNTIEKITPSLSSGESSKAELKAQQKTELVAVQKAERKYPTINLSLDEWIGWKPIIDANGGLETKRGSIFDQLGIKVSIKIINDATLSSNALIQGDINAVGYTLNRLAFLMDKFERAKVKIVVPFLCNNSSGGDGIIAKQNIKSIEDLVGKVIVVPRYSEAQTLVWWLLNNSSLSKEQIKDIENRMILVDTPDAAAKILFAGKADAAATWQPYLTQAQDPNSGFRLLFSTKNANNLILDVIAFRKDFYEDNLELVSKFIEGTLKAHDMYTKELNNIKNTMPQMADITEQDLVGMSSDATLSNYAANMETLGSGGIGLNVFNDMADIWKKLGESVPDKNYSTIFDVSALKLLDGKFSTVKEHKVAFTAEQKNVVKNESPLLTKRVIIEFGVNSAQYKNPDDAYVVLRKIADQCNIADAMIVQIEGNTSSEGSRELNTKLSFERAKTVANTLKMFGVDPTRFIIIGNGPDKPIATNNTSKGREENRRTEVSFKQAN